MFLLSLIVAAASAAPTVIRDLKVDYTVAPITVQSKTPSFSWSVDAGDARGVLSTGFELTVTKLAADAPADAAPLWSTGAVTTNQTTFVMYGGPALTSDSDYAVSLKAADGATATTTFSTALYTMADWAGSDWVEATGTAAQVRKEITLPAGKISRARAYFAMPGYGTLSINGHSVDGVAGTRTWSQYDKRTIYGVYDVTALLQSGGVNAVGVYAGAGWYGMWGYGGPCFRLILSVTIDGKTTMVGGSDSTWTFTRGPVVENSEYNGETYDARNETPGWTSAGFTPPPGAETWAPVALGSSNKNFKLKNASLDSMSFPAIDVMHTFTAKWWKEPSPGVYVFDFEQNLSGWILLKMIFCAAGQKITFRHAELLQHPPYGPIDGNIYVGNLRSAKATDTYICKGDPNGEQWSPIFTQHGFRHVEVTGLSAPPTLDMITAINVRSAVEQIGTISFSDPLMNQVQHNMLWGQSTNLMMVPTDCDQRDERLGWTGDSALTSEEALSNFDLGSFYHNWAKMIDESSPNGAVGDTIPTRPGGGNAPASGSADASWASVFPSVIWGLLKYKGDTTVGQFWPGLTRFMDNEWNHLGSPPDIKKMFAQFGDWVPPPSGQGFVGDGKASTQFTAGYSFVSDMVHVVELAKHIGTPADVTKYEGILAQAKTLFHTTWYDASKGYYENGCQTSQVLPLAVPGLVPESVKPTVLKHLINDIVNVRGNHTTCGIIGWRWELDVLSANGYGDVAYALISQVTYPSYGYEINNPVEPATTIWELWNSDSQGPSMNSRDHIMFGGPGKWIYHYAGGIGQTETSLGFEHVVLTPPATLIEQAVNKLKLNANISQPLNFVSASQKTLRGTIEFEWQVPTSVGGGTCELAAEHQPIDLSCPGSTISSVAFAEYGTPIGDCSSGFKLGKCGLNTTAAFVSKCCVGKGSCSVSCDGPVCTCAGGTSIKFDDPCYQTVKHLAVKVGCAAKPGPVGSTLNMRVAVPPGSDAQLVVPLLGAAAKDVVITEGSTAIFKDGAYVSGVAGITGASPSGDSIIVKHGSGSYLFVRSG